MSYKKDFEYRDLPFSSETPPQENFYLCDVVSKLYAKSESNKDNTIKVRTVGVFESTDGCFYIKEITSFHDHSRPPDPKHCIQVSVVYLHKTVRCSLMPYPVQLFGRLQWCNRPVIFAQIIQPLSVSAATMLTETLFRASQLHSSKREFHKVDLSTDKT